MDPQNFDVEMDHSDDSHCDFPINTPTKVVQLQKSLPSGTLESIKMSGYLEKRSKVVGWKRYWFVLDGRLLTYYKSKSEYESLAACCGSVNLGIATNVSPIRATHGYPIQIVTRTHIYFLRAMDKTQSDKWLIAIQEAATIPPSISLPYWTDPGVQFYRYTFTALSQWSLNASNEDISSIRNLPQNFYRPSSLLKKCHSFAALNLNFNKTGWRGSDDSDYNNYSDYSNQSYNTYHSTLGYKSTRKSKKNQDAISGNKIPSKMRHSMVALESSPQAEELRQELAKILSIRMGNKGGDIPHFSNVIKSPDNEMMSSDMNESFGDSHYEDSYVHHDNDDDDNLDLNQGLYQPRSSMVDVGDTFDMHGSADSSPIVNMIESKDYEDPLEKWLANQNHHTMSASPENSSRFSKIIRQKSGEISGRSSLASIAEVPTKTTNERKSFGNCNVQGGAASCNNGGEGKQKEKNPKIRSLTKRNSITGFFHKIFAKTEKKKKDLVITGPVDLRQIRRNQETNQSLKKQPDTTTSRKSEYNQSKTHDHLKQVKPSVGSSTEDFIQELNKTIDELARSEFKSGKPDSNAAISSKSVNIQKKKEPEDLLSKVHTTEKVKSEDQGNSHEQTKDNSLTTISPTPDELQISNESSAEYQSKLERFNSLSQSLNPSFIAALTQSSAVSHSAARRVSRSQSCRFRKVEEPPVLPPKHIPPKMSEYDVPQNNRPVNKNEVVETKRSARLSGIHELTKKHSVPEVNFSPRRTGSSGCSFSGSDGTSLLSKHMDPVNDVDDDVFSPFQPPAFTSNILILKPPPRPPKLETPDKGLWQVFPKRNPSQQIKKSLNEAPVSLEINNTSVNKGYVNIGLAASKPKRVTRTLAQSPMETENDTREPNINGGEIVPSGLTTALAQSPVETEKGIGGHISINVAENVLSEVTTTVEQSTGETGNDSKEYINTNPPESISSGATTTLTQCSTESGNDTREMNLNLAKSIPCEETATLAQSPAETGKTNCWDDANCVLVKYSEIEAETEAQNPNDSNISTLLISKKSQPEDIVERNQQVRNADVIPHINLMNLREAIFVSEVVVAEVVVSMDSNSNSQSSSLEELQGDDDNAREDALQTTLVEDADVENSFKKADSKIIASELNSSQIFESGTFNNNQMSPGTNNPAVIRRTEMEDDCNSNVSSAGIPIFSNIPKKVDIINQSPSLSNEPIDIDNMETLFNISTVPIQLLP